MKIDFNGKRALVTGASQGIGKTIVKALVAANARVVAVARNSERLQSLQQELGSKVEVVVADLSDWKGTQQALKNVGNIDLLVNNAALANLQPFGEITEDAFDTTMALNVKAVINVSQMCIESMKKKRSGAIVNISSQAGIAALRDHSVYCASKAALDQLTRVMALELGEFNIRVNSVNPTVTMTPMALVGWSDPVKAKGMKDKIPLGRFAEPEEVADAVIYLLSDKASMISGTILPIDGGFTAC